MSQIKGMSIRLQFKLTSSSLKITNNMKRFTSSLVLETNCLLFCTRLNIAILLLIVQVWKWQWQLC